MFSFFSIFRPLFLDRYCSNLTELSKINLLQVADPTASRPKDVFEARVERLRDPVPVDDPAEDRRPKPESPERQLCLRQHRHWRWWSVLFFLVDENCPSTGGLCEEKELFGIVLLLLLPTPLYRLSDVGAPSRLAEVLS
ncbi:unnamed protein product [Caenorhabditis auriculariae]|uniref:Uncharacterized protein n=1 Tax=Caenorhabditis auriculariae TaxID=2777116 RepID=A0A8S1HH89_9PELO|nr:unnamed protein product [Caenorhabditis auriculariae]